ncbi:Caspase domain [Rhizoctonia solani]|uniref:Caspase domain n=1 Tax=Rhizoctonia solani TaxID=456999 RepID=A0A8H7IIT8_9AGAM|nr:Caspase domain [Rhizoctonia solani]
MDFIKSALRSAAADYAQEMGVPRAVFDHIFPLDDENGNEYDPPTPPNEIHVPNSQQQHYGPTVYGEDGEEKQPLHYKLSQATDYFGYEETNIRVLTDSESSHGEIGEALSTRENIVGYIRWLVEDAEPDDSLFFHSICPTDYETAGVLVDDELHDLLVKPLPEGAGLTALFDSCHSGSVLDLPWTQYETSGAIKEPDDLQGEAEAEAVAIDAHQKRFKWSPADVISLSGCRDSQTSADAQFGGLPSGALSYAFIRAFAKFPQMTYAQLLKVIRNELRGKFDQRPQLSSSHPIDMDLLFIQ